MRLVYVDRSIVLGGVSRSGGFGVTKLMGILDEFARSEADFAEVVFEDWEYSSLQSACSALRSSVIRFGYTFRVRTFKGKLYLDKK